MKPLDDKFTRKGIIYGTIFRTERAGFFKLSIEIPDDPPEVCVGYEVCRIIQNPEREIAGKVIRASESIPSDDMFSMVGDTDKCFFPFEYERAYDYFVKLDADLIAKAEKRTENAKFYVA